MTRKQSKNYSGLKEGWRVFGWGILIATLILGPTILKNQGVLVLSNDFEMQQIPFGMANNLAIKAGEIFWEPLNELGSSFIGSYSFYTLGSPFYWLSLLFPATWYPYLIGPLLILKFAVASLTSYYYIRSFVKEPKYALWGSWLYAFSGFQLMNMMFNHFHDVVALFPLLLIALDQAVLKNRKGFFLGVVALLSLTNYYFFIGQVLFLIFYFSINVLMKRYRLSWRQLMVLALESLLGVGISACLWLPTLAFVLGNPRLSTHESPFFYTWGHYLEMLKGIFLFPESMANYSWAFQDTATSCSLYLPFVGPIFVFLYFKSNVAKDWIKLLLLTGLMGLMTPYFGGMFSLWKDITFRWFYLYLLFMALASASAMEFYFTEAKLKDQKVALNLLKKLLIGGVVIGGIVGCVYVYRYTWEVVRLFLIVTCSPLMFYFILCWVWQQKGVDSFKWIQILTVVAIVWGGWTMILRSHWAYQDDLPHRYLEEDSELKALLGESENYRLDTSFLTRNRHYIFNKPSTNGFNSNLNSSLFQLYGQLVSPLSTERSVVTCHSPKYYAYQTLTSVKYMIEAEEDSFSIRGESCLNNINFWFNRGALTYSVEADHYNFYPLKKEVYAEEGYRVYENLGFIPMGFVFDRYISQQTVEQIDYQDRALYVLKGIILNQEQIERYQDVLTEVDSDALMDLSVEAYQKDVERLNQQVCKHFEYTQKGFSCQIKIEKKGLLFFSIPYDEGWQATVNGQPVRIEKVDVGLMAIQADIGEQEVVFTYSPVGLKAGITLSVGSLLVTITYLLWRRQGTSLG